MTTEFTLIISILLLLCGCSIGQDEREWKSTAPASGASALNELSAPDDEERRPEDKTDGRELEIMLTEPDSGKVVWVDSKLKFVVLDFSDSHLPVESQRMWVYRGGRRVGELRISSKRKYNCVVADVLNGEVKIGDEVRFEDREEE
ncbi:MAG: hypothetical protein K9N48_00050 [Verrucomicrobia bacterium]|nr:hypothetical protein [Verrucomicrobiota bacterium]MCF7708397.1 hypothetical protein [Verrucomicrobiota bacterium]